MAPRPELYDFLGDPDEAHNLIGELPRVAERLRAALATYESGIRPLQPGQSEPDPQLSAALRSLGYLD